MIETTNYKLKKYEGRDFFSILHANDNMDIIDRELKGLLDKIGDLETLKTEQKLNLVGAINEVLTKLGSIKLEADKVTIKDLQNLFVSDKVEGALAEVMNKAKDNETSILSLQNADGNLLQLQTSNKSNLVGAINELFQNANNGKYTIATAIGSPLSSGDTFSAMGSKIDTLTSKFKTNLNAKGISTSSSDKMSNLIDKVGMISLGKKWASGSTDYTVSTSSTKTYTIPFSIDFDVKLAFIEFETAQSRNSGMYATIKNASIFDVYPFGTTKMVSPTANFMRIDSADKNGLTFTYYHSGSPYPAPGKVTWYVFD